MKTIETTQLAVVTGGAGLPWYHPDANKRDEALYDYKPRSWTKCTGGFWFGCPDERIPK